MSLLENFIDRLVARVEAEAASDPPEPVHPVEPPYACLPTCWGEESPETPRREPPPPAPTGFRKPRRMTLEVRREPAPRGLLSS